MGLTSRDLKEPFAVTDILFILIVVAVMTQIYTCDKTVYVNHPGF